MQIEILFDVCRKHVILTHRIGPNQACFFSNFCKNLSRGFLAQLLTLCETGGKIHTQSLRGKMFF